MELIRKYRQGELTIADVRTLNNAVICLLCCIAVTSIVWSMTLHVLADDLYNVLVGAKLAFRERDLSQLDHRSSIILQHDLDLILNATYLPPSVVEDTVKADDGIVINRLIMDEENQTTTTAKPKVRKISHLFQISSNMNQDEEEDSSEELDDANETTVAPVEYDIEGDRQFLTYSVIDVHQTIWRKTAAVQFIYSFPFWSEIVAIIWLAMCLIYQSSVKKYWGLPKPWRIVIPSIIMFTLMTGGTLVYTILANRYLKHFCTDVRSHLSNPSAISCGQAISLLRPIVRSHVFKHDVYLNVFHISYLLSLVLWVLALLIVLVRYIFAIDFQLVEIAPSYSEKLPDDMHPEVEFKEVLLSSPQHQLKLAQVDECHKSDEDYESARSHLSEVVAPLLDQPPLQKKT